MSDLLDRALDVMQKGRVGRYKLAKELHVGEKVARGLLDKIKTIEKDVGFECCLVFGDVHIPFEDARAVDVMLRFASHLQPDVIILGGDIIDCYELSRFPKDPRRGASFRAELEKGREFLERVRSACPKSKIQYVIGNHEFRLKSYIIKQAPALAGANGSTIQSLLGMDKLRVECIENEGDQFIDTYTTFGGILIGHFDVLSSLPGNTARRLLDIYSESCIQGHTHSMASACKTVYPDKQIMGFENGCLCDLKPSYCTPRNWVQGFTVIHKEKIGKYYQVQQIPMFNHQFRYGGKLWRA